MPPKHEPSRQIHPASQRNAFPKTPTFCAVGGVVCVPELPHRASNPRVSGSLVPRPPQGSNARGLELAWEARLGDVRACGLSHAFESRFPPTGNGVTFCSACLGAARGEEGRRGVGLQCRTRRRHPAWHLAEGNTKPRTVVLSKYLAQIGSISPSLRAVLLQT
jgi:hypothetical protein